MYNGKPTVGSVGFAGTRTTRRTKITSIYPGKYANGIITKTYREGQEIEVLIEITSNHVGAFYFKIGELDTEPITEENWFTC